MSDINRQNPCRRPIRTALGLTLLLLPTFPLWAQTVTVSVPVPGTSDPWLAGMPDGSTASDGDVAPDQSPAQVYGLSYSAGGVFTFTATGAVGFQSGDSAPPDGEGMGSHGDGAQNGLSDITAPDDALLGVFLGPDQPDLSAAPGALDFSAPGAVDYLSLSPALQQVFFIGDGVTSTGEVQQVIAPAGASRLFLGTMDGGGWFNNPGSFSVSVTGPAAAPEPSQAAAMCLGVVCLGGLTLRARKRRVTA